MGALDDLLPIRRIKVDGEVQPFVRDIDFDSGTIDVTVDEAAGVATVGLGSRVPQLPSTASVIQPSGDTTGATDRAAIQAALTAGRPVYLVPGATYYLDQAVTLPTGAKLLCSGPGRAVVQAASAWAPAAGSADDRTIALLLATGTVGSTVNTTLATIALRGDRQINPTSTTSMVDGTWLLLQGTTDTHSTGDVYNASGQEAVEQIVQLSGAPAAGWVTLAQGCRSNHRITGTTVKDCTPVTDVEIHGIDFVTTGNHACAISCRYAARIRVSDVSFSGFARAGLDAYGVHALHVGHVHNAGGCNSLVKGETCQDCIIGDGSWTYAATATRYHANGIPRAQIDFSGRCYGLSIDVGTLGRGVCAMRLVGSFGCSVAFFTAVDFDSAQSKSRDPQTLGSQVATGLESGANDTSGPEAAEFGFGNHFEGILCIDHRHDDAGSVPSDAGVCVYLHDDYLTTVGSIQVLNKGRTYTDSLNGDGNFFCAGVSFKDWIGTVDSIGMTGVSYAIQTYGSYVNAQIAAVNLHGNAGRSLAVYPTYFNHAGESGLYFGTLRIDGYGHWIRFGSSFADVAMRIGTLICSTDIFTNVIPAYASSAVTVGKIVEMASTGTASTTKRRCAHAGAATVKPAVCAIGGPFDVSTGWVMVSLLPGRMNTIETAAAVNAGDKLESNASSVAAVNASTTFDAFIGRAMQQTAAGGKTLVGP